MTRFFLKASFVVLIISFLLIPFHVAWALYEVENANASAPTGLTTQQPPADSLQVEWAEPEMDTNDSVVEYVFIWNNSDALLDDTELNQSTNDGIVDKDGLLKATKNSSDFAGEDYDDPYWYFHIKTVYFNTTEGEKLGDDLFVGPFNFDDQAPEGTIALDTNVVGQTTTTSLINPVTLALTATPDTEMVYLSNTSSQPQTGVDFANTLTHTVTEGVGEKTIYIWFEDQAGNTSSFYTLTFNIIAGKSMDPAPEGNDTFKIEIGGSQPFIINGAEAAETFDWEIVNSDPENVASVLSFEGDSQAAATSITIQADKEGTFKLKATSNTDAAVYTSGTITVVKSTSMRQFTLIYNEDNTSVNAISLPFAVNGLNAVSDLYAQIPNCDGIQWWDAVSQSYKPYNQWVPETNIDLSVGGVYFVSISQNLTEPLTFEGTEENVQFTLRHNDDNTSVNSISVPYDVSLSNVSELYASINNCDGIQWWDAVSQSYKLYNQWVPETNISIEKGDPFFVSITTTTLWP